MRCMRRRNKGSSFTFVEMLVVTALVAVISLGIYATLSNGLKVYRRVQRELPEEDLNIFFQKFSMDVGNSIRFSGVYSSGVRERLEIVTLVASPRFPVQTVGKVVYFYNPGARQVSREQYDFSQFSNNQEGTLSQTIGNVKSCIFTYYLYDKEKKEFYWSDEWGLKEVPLAVRMELELESDGYLSTYERTVDVPPNA